MMSRYRIGAVSYLNSKPLIEGLEELLPEAELILDFPSKLADMLAADEIDVGLIPSAEYLSHSNYRLVSDACVATRGPVLSVKLYGRKPFCEIETLALDEGSRTSVLLTRILLSQRYNLFPELRSLPLGRSVESSDADAVLVIGDRAFHPPEEKFVEIWDLGEEWTKWSGLPFVFAVWAASEENDLSAVEQALVEARNNGLNRLAEIAQREAAVLGIDEQVAYDYLRRNLYFRLGEEEQKGLELFSKLAEELIPQQEGLIVES